MKITYRRIDHIQICIPVGKEDEARVFYTGILGLIEIEKPESLAGNGGLWYQMGDIQLHIGVEENRRSSKAHPAFEVVNINAIRTYFKSLSIPVQEEIMIPGTNRFSFFDPFGNRIEFLEPMI